MAQSSITRRISFCLPPSSSSHLLYQFSFFRNLSPLDAFGSCTRYLWTFRRNVAPVQLVVRPGSDDFLYAEATPSTEPRCSTCLQMHGGLISRYSTSLDKAKSKQKSRRLEDTSTNARKSRPRFVMLGFGALMVTVGGYFLYHSKERKSPTKARKPEPGKVNLASHSSVIGGPFKLINHKGEVVTDRDLVGKWTLFYFGYTSCPDVCPEELQKLAEAVGRIEKQTNQEVVPVFCTLDPERDSIAQIQAYIAEFHPRLVGLTGTVDEIRQVAREYRVYFKKVEDEGSDYLVDHSNFMFWLAKFQRICRFSDVELSVGFLLWSSLVFLAIALQCCLMWAWRGERLEPKIYGLDETFEAMIWPLWSRKHAR